MSREKQYLKEKLYPNLSYKVVGVLYKVFNELGGQLQERYYYSLIKTLLEKEKIKFDFQKKININNQFKYFIDFLMGGQNCIRN